MKTNYLITFIFVLPMWGMSQMNSSIDLMAGLDYSFRYLTTSSDEDVVQSILESREEEEEGKLNWRFGFHYNKRLSTSFFLKAGLRLSSVGYERVREDTLRWGTQHNGMGGFEPGPDSFREIRLISDYWFLEVPIAGRFEFNQNKWAPFLELGIAPSIYLTERSKLESNQDPVISFQDNTAVNFNQLHVIGFISVGMHYTLNGQYQFFGQPTLRYHFTPLADGPIKEYLFNYGLEIGVRRRIN